MKSTLAILLMLFLLVSCGERGELSQAKFKIFSGYLAETTPQFPGGLLVMGKKSDGSQSFILPYQPNLELELKKGIWDFATIGWSGPYPMEGNQQCSFQKVELNTDTVSVAFNMNHQNCLNMSASDGSRFISPLFYNFSGGAYNGFKKLKVKICSDLSTPCSTGGDPTYFKITIPSRLVGIPATAQTNSLFQSRCILGGTSEVTPPHGGPNGFIGTQITTYKAVQATFHSPEGTAIDANGNVFIADSYEHTIRKITREGNVTTFAGQAGVSGTTDGVGSAARFYGPRALAIDSSGNIYVADQGNNLIRKIAPDATVTTIAGDGTNSHLDGTGTAARFASPRGIALDGAGNLYVGEYGNTIRKIVLSTGAVSTVAGSGSPGSSDNVNPLLATFGSVEGLAVDNAGNIYVADNGSHRIRKIDAATLAVTTIAGSTYGYANGPGSSAQFNNIHGIVVDKIRNFLYVADSNNNNIRKIDLNDTNYNVTTLAGGDYTHYGPDDGIGSSARFTSPYYLAFKDDTLYISDYDNHNIRKLAIANNGVSTFAGVSTTYGSTDGVGVIFPCGNGDIKDYFFPHGFGEQLNTSMNIGGVNVVRRGALSFDASATDPYYAINNMKFLGLYSNVAVDPAAGQNNDVYFYNGSSQLAVFPYANPDDFLVYNGSQWLKVPFSDSVKLFLQN